MSLITVIVVLVIVGLILYFINKHVPLAEPVKKALNVVVVLGLCLWLLNAFGLMIAPTSPK